MPPAPEVPHDNAPGLARAKVHSSWAVRNREFCGTANSVGASPSTAIGEKSATGSNGVCCGRATGLMPWLDALASSQV